MATEYVDKLSNLIRELKIEDQLDSRLEVKHFFSGAALYANDRICVSWSPVGLAFRLSEKDASRLIASGKVKPLRYFSKGHVKKEYALFEKPGHRKASHWRKYFVEAARRSSQ